MTTVLKCINPLLIIRITCLLSILTTKEERKNVVACRHSHTTPTQRANHSPAGERPQSLSHHGHHGPHQTPPLSLLFFDTQLFLPCSKHCKRILHHFPFDQIFTQSPLFCHHRPHLRKVEKDASQEGRQGREDPSRPARQQLEERHRE
jgi:hypothetical protein